MLIYVRGGRREAAIFQEGAVLSDFYDVDEVIARYQAAGVTLDRKIFSAQMDGLARAVVTGNLRDDLRLPITGLCLGYPIDETLERLRRA